MDGPRASPYDGALAFLGRIEGSPPGLRPFGSHPSVRHPLPGSRAARGFNETSHVIRGKNEGSGTRGPPNPNEQVTGEGWRSHVESSGDSKRPGPDLQKRYRSHVRYQILKKDQGEDLPYLLNIDFHRCFRICSVRMTCPLVFPPDHVTRFVEPTCSTRPGQWVANRRVRTERSDPERTRVANPRSVRGMQGHHRTGTHVVRPCPQPTHVPLPLPMT